MAAEELIVAEHGAQSPVFEGRVVEPTPVIYAGLGKMGLLMAGKLSNEGHDVFGYDADESARDRARAAGLTVFDTLEETVEAAGEPGERFAWNMLPAKVTEQGLLAVSGLLQEGDIVVDGGNAHYKDTDRRAEWMANLGLRFLGVGISGGVTAVETGYPQMVGGDFSAYSDSSSVFDSLARSRGGHKYFGPGGAGHAVKMVHNAIEYPYMEAIGEGFGILRQIYPEMDLAEVAELYTQGTLVSGYMMDRTVEVLRRDPDLSEQSGVIGSASGDTVWTLQEARRLEEEREIRIPTESIEQAVDFRKRSATDPEVSGSDAAKMVAALRAQFGGHTQDQQYVK
jgi:6-phosphogluconate dehydrogenase